MKRIGLLGASGIAPLAIIQPVSGREDCEIVCVAARDGDKARTYANAHSIPDSVEGYEALIARDDIDLIYNGLMHNRHADLSIAAVQSGKAVLCEKPFAMNANEAERMVAASVANGQPIIEGYHYRYHPAFAEFSGEVAKLGKLSSVSGRFCVPLPPDGTRFDFSLGGGSLMDLGCYPLHALRSLTAVEPTIVSANAVGGPEHVDVAMTAHLDFDGIAGEIHCDMSQTAGRELNLSVKGEDGEVSIHNFVHPYRGYTISKNGEMISGGETEATTFDHQLAHVMDVLVGRTTPQTGGVDALANMQAIDAIYRAAGMSPRGL